MDSIDNAVRRYCLDADVEAALTDLRLGVNSVAADAWPGDLADLNIPGLYSWYVDEQGARDLSVGIGVRIAPGLVYAGQTDATKWPSGNRGKATLASRIGGNHLRGRIRSSTFRLTLAAALARPLHLTPTGRQALHPTSEQTLSRWMREHLEVAVYPFPHADSLDDLEHRVLVALDPPLNINGLATSAARSALTSRRRLLSTPHV